MINNGVLSDSLFQDGLHCQGHPSVPCQYGDSSRVGSLLCDRYSELIRNNTLPSQTRLTPLLHNSKLQLLYPKQIQANSYVIFQYITLPHSLTFIALQFVGGQLYTNSFLAMYVIASILAGNVSCSTIAAEKG
jgi:hypothetical protein